MAATAPTHARLCRQRYLRLQPRQADDRIVYNNAPGAVLYDADGVNGNAAIQFATLATGLALTNTDFVVARS